MNKHQVLTVLLAVSSCGVMACSSALDESKALCEKVWDCKSFTCDAMETKEATKICQEQLDEELKQCNLVAENDAKAREFLNNDCRDAIEQQILCNNASFACIETVNPMNSDEKIHHLSTSDECEILTDFIKDACTPDKDVEYIVIDEDNN